MPKTVKERLTREDVELLNVGDSIEFVEDGKVKVKKVKKKDILEDGTIVLVSIMEVSE